MFASKDIGIDLGTANVLVYLKGKGIIINEPSVVAKNTQTGEVVAVGEEAKKMIGRTPENIVALRPMKGGVIADFDTTSVMLKYFVSKTKKKVGTAFKKMRVVVCAPSGATGVEKRAIIEATMQAGVGEVFLIEEPFAAAIGANLPVSEPIGSMVVDIGGGTTEIAIISLGGIVTSNSLRVAGDTMDHAIVQFIRKEYKLLIGERTAENLKMSLGYAVEPKEVSYEDARGRNYLTGLPETITVSSSDIHRALSESLSSITEKVIYTFEKCPPELSGDILDRGIVLTGGGALLKDLAVLLKKETDIPVLVADNPLDCVAIGTGLSLNHIDILKRSQIQKK